MTDNSFLINSSAVSDRGLSEKRPQNEDSYLEMPNLGLFAVADGVGGAQAGDVASQMAMEILSEAFVNLQTNGDAEEMMRVAIERANNAIYQMSSDLPQLSTMATTIVALHISGSIATIGHVGDSRLYRLDPRGSLYRETQDHSVVEEEVRAGRMTAAQAANHPSRNVISRALGAESTVEVDMKTIMFDPNTSFLLCSDGITRHITDFEIRDLLMSSENPSEICARMKEICYSRGAEDNLTAVIIQAVGAKRELANDELTAPVSLDVDEATVAAARPAAASGGFSSFADDYDEMPTRDLQLPSSMQAPPPQTNSFSESEIPATIPSENPVYADTDEQFLMEDTAVDPTFAETVPIETETPAAFPPDTKPNAYETAPSPKPKPYKEFTVYTEPEKSSGSGAFGKILSALVWLLVGAMAGFGAYYFWNQSNVPQAEVPKLAPQTNNITFASYEKFRREAYEKPDTIIANYDKAPPRDAADFYFLGMARFFKGDYEGAKQSFIEARNQLKDYGETDNKAVLANDITMGLTIVQDRNALSGFEREKKFLNGGESNAQPNANSGANLSVPGGAGASEN